MSSRYANILFYTLQVKLLHLQTGLSEEGYHDIKLPVSKDFCTSKGPDPFVKSRLVS